MTYHYSFDDILGNANLLRTLRNSVNTGRISHSYIIEGAEGSGKRLIARSFARLLFCKTREPNCACHSCKQFESGSHTGIYEIRPREKAKSIGVDQVRDEIVKDLFLKPFEYNRKVYIIERAETLTKEAQNALLRSIEEPPEYAVFLLLTTEKLLPTIQSRCFLAKTEPLSIDSIINQMTSSGKEISRSKICALYSNGALGKALLLYENEGFFEIRKQINDLLTRLKDTESDTEGTLSTIGEIAKTGASPDEFILIAQTWFRDILAYKTSKSVKTLLQSDFADGITSSADAFTYKSVYMKLNALSALQYGIYYNAPFAAALDAMAIRMTGNAARN